MRALLTCLCLSWLLFYTDLTSNVLSRGAHFPNLWRSVPQCRFLRSSNFSLNLCVNRDIFGYIQIQPNKGTLQKKRINLGFLLNLRGGIADLEKAASGASGACGHFIVNHAILRTFWVKYHVLLTEDGGRRVRVGEMRSDQGDLRQKDGEWSI